MDYILSLPPSIITRMEQCTWKLLTDEVIPFSVQSRMLGKATLHHVGAHVAARQHVAGDPAARRTDGHPRERSCALRRRLQLRIEIFPNRFRRDRDFYL